MTKINILSVRNTNFHRNGVGGAPFYSAIMGWEEIYNDEREVFVNMLVTFQTDENNKKVDTTTCRVISLDSPKENWRGDVIAEAIQEMFKKTKVKDIYKYMKEGY